MSEEDAKAALRKALFAKRKAAHEERATRDLAANARLPELIPEPEGLVIAGFRPIRTEIDPTQAMVAFHEAGARICVPVVIADGAPLEFRAWSPGCRMEPGAFGAEIPADAESLTPDVIIAPLLGWDRAGGRLGYGGGFYDRSLQKLRAARKTVAIGFAYAAQEVDKVATGPHDETLDAIVTEDEVLRIRY